MLAICNQIECMRAKNTADGAKVGLPYVRKAAQDRRAHVTLSWEAAAPNKNRILLFS